jgi:hypothetical protein
MAVPPLCCEYQRKVAPAGPVALSTALVPLQVVTVVASSVGAAGTLSIFTTPRVRTGFAQLVEVFTAST